MFSAPLGEKGGVLGDLMGKVWIEGLLPAPSLDMPSFLFWFF